MRSTTVLALAAVETVTALAFLQYLVGVVVFYVLFVVVLGNLLSLLLLRRRARAAAVLAVFSLHCILAATCGFVRWRVQSEASDLAAFVQTLHGSSGAAAESAIRSEADTYPWLKTHLTDAHAEDDGSVTFFYYVLKPSIAHWYNSVNGWGHSSD